MTAICVMRENQGLRADSSIPDSSKISSSSRGQMQEPTFPLMAQYSAAQLCVSRGSRITPEIAMHCVLIVLREVVCDLHGCS